MEPACSSADLAFLAERIRAEGVDASVEAEASRVHLPGNCYARPDAAAQVLGWAEGPDVLWYGRFGSVEELVHVARRIRRLRVAARVGLGLLGVWVMHGALGVVPGYRTLTRDLTTYQGALALCALLGALTWLTARVLRWRLTRRRSGVVWVRSPWERA